MDDTFAALIAANYTDAELLDTAHRQITAYATDSARGSAYDYRVYLQRAMELIPER